MARSRPNSRGKPRPAMPRRTTRQASQGKDRTGVARRGRSHSASLSIESDEDSPTTTLVHEDCLTITRTKPADNETVWYCDLNGCSKYFLREADLKRHQRTSKQHNSKAYFCGCGRSFTRQDATRRHCLSFGHEIPAILRVGRPEDEPSSPTSDASQNGIALLVAAAALSDSNGSSIVSEETLVVSSETSDGEVSPSKQTTNPIFCEPVINSTPHEAFTVLRHGTRKRASRSRRSDPPTPAPLLLSQHGAFPIPYYHSEPLYQSAAPSTLSPPTSPTSTLVPHRSLERSPSPNAQGGMQNSNSEHRRRVERPVLAPIDSSVRHRVGSGQLSPSSQAGRDLSYIPGRSPLISQSFAF